MKFDDNDNDELWIELCLEIIVIFSFLSQILCFYQSKGVPDSQTNDLVKKHAWYSTTQYACNLTSQPFWHMQIYSVGQVSPTRSRRVKLVRLWRCQGLGSLGRQRRSWEMKSLGLWPHLMPHSNVCILHKFYDFPFLVFFGRNFLEQLNFG